LIYSSAYLNLIYILLQNAKILLNRLFSSLCMLPKKHNHVVQLIPGILITIFSFCRLLFSISLEFFLLKFYLKKMSFLMLIANISWMLCWFHLQIFLFTCRIIRQEITNNTRMLANKTLIVNNFTLIKLNHSNKIVFFLLTILQSFNNYILYDFTYFLVFIGFYLK
jgi:hypothetical protein